MIRQLLTCQRSDLKNRDDWLRTRFPLVFMANAFDTLAKGWTDEPPVDLLRFPVFLL